MSDSNPYETQASESPPNSIDNLQTAVLVKATLFVASLAVLGGVAGMIIGGCLGALLPNYYRSAMPRGGEAGFDPLAIGIGQGLTQGTVFGGLMAVLILGLYLWHQRKQRPGDLRA